MRCVWIFLCDRCDHAGIWEIDEEALEFYTSADTSIGEIIEIFGDKIQRVGKTKLLVAGFIDFQYGELNPESRVHKSVLHRLEKEGLSKGYLKSFQTLKDKDKDKDKDKAKDSLKEGSGEKTFKPDLAAIYARYPRKEGKSKGLDKLKASIKGSADYLECLTAIDNFLAHLKRSGTEAEFIPHFKTWAGSWRDWLDPDHGKAECFAAKVPTLDDLDLPAKEPA